ncbi:plasmid pRiA4b ORF-3 family protein [Aquipuribacter sp. MA13-6]|uniref:plasmid pRiA4b ORF-3 family protein n=1 Tax=unclassified Aquipuribacter TaxID=2635084 RepID=UPI003EED8316
MGKFGRADLAQVLAMVQAGRPVEDVMAGVAQSAEVGAPPERHERRDVAVRYRVRLELTDVSRPVTRTVELPSDVFLDEVSDVVQAAYGWLGYHLHRFATGDPFAPGAEVYLCPFEVDDGEDGLDARDVRLDELLASPGDTCRYAYDYGDGWEVELRLLDVVAADADGPRVRCTTGEGAPPPEDSGGPGGYDDLVAERMTPDGLPFDPDAFDPQQVTRSMSSELGFRRGRRRGVRQERYQWLLDRVSGGGLSLTDAGYLRPVDVRAAFDDWGLDDEWIGTGNREVHTVPVREVREGALALRLVRRYKGRLLLTRLGAQARRDPEVLRAQLGRLVD